MCCLEEVYRCLHTSDIKHIGPLGLAFLTSMLKTALNTNIIPHIWKLANIVPIPKPNKDIDKGTSYMPISLLSIIAKTLEKSLLPYITANISNTPTQHGYKTQHSTVTALHTVNNTVANGFNQMALHARVWYVRDVLYAVLYVRVSCFVMRGCAVSRRYINVCNCDILVLLMCTLTI